MNRTVNGEEVELQTPPGVEVTPTADRLVVRTPSGTGTALCVAQADSILVSYQGRQFVVDGDAARPRARRTLHSGEIRAPMPGMISDVAVQAGQSVKKGDKLVVLEAMKTQQAFLAPFDGVVDSVSVEIQEQVAEGHLLVLVVETESPATV